MIDYNNVLLSFDLDNTLINNREGIVNSFNYALQEFNLPLMKKHIIEEMIGIPLREMFLSITEDNTQELITTFREYYISKGIYQGKLLKGVRKKLNELKRIGFTLGVITSKKEEMAQKIVRILKIEHYFDYILGETEERKELGKLDPSFKKFFQENYPRHQIIVVGDHPKDAMLSNNLECPFIGVLTGNHSADQLINHKIGRINVARNVGKINVKMIEKLLIEN